MRYLCPTALFAGTIWLIVSFWTSRPIHHGPGVLVPVEPVQEDVPPQFVAEVAGFKLTGVARYTVRARVLGTKRYWNGRGAELVPVDVAIGWGAMSDSAVLDVMKLSQSNRFFFYQWQYAPPIPPDEIMKHAANNHVIAANSKVASAVKALRTGQIAQMQGWLVDARAADGFAWPTSRRRDDTGNGACELFYVESIAAVNGAEAAASSAIAVSTAVAAH